MPSPVYSVLNNSRGGKGRETIQQHGPTRKAHIVSGSLMEEDKLANMFKSQAETATAQLHLSSVWNQTASFQRNVRHPQVQIPATCKQTRLCTIRSHILRPRACTGVPDTTASSLPLTAESHSCNRCTPTRESILAMGG